MITVLQMCLFTLTKSRSVLATPPKEASNVQLRQANARGVQKQPATQIRSLEFWPWGIWPNPAQPFHAHMRKTRDMRQASINHRCVERHLDPNSFNTPTHPHTHEREREINNNIDKVKSSRHLVRNMWREKAKSNRHITSHGVAKNMTQTNAFGASGRPSQIGPSHHNACRSTQTSVAPFPCPSPQPDRSPIAPFLPQVILPEPYVPTLL